MYVKNVFTESFPEKLQSTLMRLLTQYLKRTFATKRKFYPRHMLVFNFHASTETPMSNDVRSAYNRHDHGKKSCT